MAKQNNSKRYAVWRAVLLFSLAVCSVKAQTTGTTNLSLTVTAEATLTINTSTTTLTSSSGFNPFTGTTNFTYVLRTSVGTGSGNIQLQITSDFSPTGGPSVASPIVPADKLTYTCSGSSPATPCSSAITATTVSQTSVATFGADAHSASAGSTGSVTWSLVNDPAYKAGTFTGVATFTISAT
jgi:hypothetical protein